MQNLRNPMKKGFSIGGLKCTHLAIRTKFPAAFYILMDPNDFNHTTVFP